MGQLAEAGERVDRLPGQRHLQRVGPRLRHAQRPAGHGGGDHRAPVAGAVQTLGLTDAAAALEAELGVSFSAHEGVRYEHRDRLFPLFDQAFAARATADLAPAFEAEGVCWSLYRTLSEAAADPALFEANPVFGHPAHPSGRDYPAPGPAATLSSPARRPVTPAPRLGADTDQVLAEVLGLSAGEIGRLHDTGVVAGAS